MLIRRPSRAALPRARTTSTQSSVDQRDALRRLLRYFRFVDGARAVPYKFISQNAELVEARADRLLPSLRGRAAGRLSSSSLRQVVSIIVAVELLWQGAISNQ